MRCRPRQSACGLLTGSSSLLAQAVTLEKQSLRFRVEGLGFQA